MNSKRSPQTDRSVPLSILVPTLLLAVVLAASSGLASDHVGEPFTNARFDALQSEGALILVDVSASWCGACAKQSELVTRHRKAHPDVPLHLLRVDFDGQKEWVRFFGAPRQSTLVLYRGGERVWFAVAETREQVLFERPSEAAKG